MRSLGIYIYSCLVDGCMCWVGWLVVLGNVIVTYRWMYIYIYIYICTTDSNNGCFISTLVFYVGSCMSSILSWV